jgi:hypothetical protein
MQRTAIGICGVIVFLGGVLLYLFGPNEDAYAMAAASGVRVGLVLGAIWLSYPQLARVPWWLVRAGLAVVLVIAALPRPALARAAVGIVVPLLIALWLLRPRPPRKKSSGAPRRKTRAKA